MRRVYYIYTLRLLKHPVTVHVAVVLAGLFLLSRIVSLPNVWANMLSVRVGDLAHFWINAFSTTESVTLIVVAVIVMAVLSLPWRLRSQHQLMEMGGHYA